MLAGGSLRVYAYHGSAALVAGNRESTKLLNVRKMTSMVADSDCCVRICRMRAAFCKR